MQIMTSSVIFSWASELGIFSLNIGEKQHFLALAITVDSLFKRELNFVILLFCIKSREYEIVNTNFSLYF